MNEKRNYNACDILGCPESLIDGGQIVSSGSSLVEYAVSLVFPGLIVIGVFVIVKSAYRFIKSEGVTQEIESSQKAIKRVFIGIIMLFLGFVGYILILSFFNASKIDLSSDSIEKPGVIKNIDVPFI